MACSEKTKYQIWYEDLVCSRRKSGNFSLYTEVHHILPRSMGGDDEETNLVRLTYREHFIAHWLLTKFVVGQDLYKMQRALFAMTLCANGTRIAASWQFDVAKRAIKDLQVATSLRNAAEEARQIALQRERDECVARFLAQRNNLSRKADVFLEENRRVMTALPAEEVGESRYRRRRRRQRPSKRARALIKIKRLAAQAAS